MALRVVWFCPLNIMPYADKVKFIDNKLPVILAPWIDDYIKLLRENTELEVHIIAEYPTLEKDTEFNDGNVKIHLISQKMPFLKRGWPHRVRYFSNYFLLYRKVKQLLKKINPDFIHLHGTEHDLSAVTLRLKTPKLVTIQGFINEAVKRNNNPYMQRKLKIENKIFSNCKYFGIRVQQMEEIVKKYNKKATFFYHYYVIERPCYLKQVECDTDVIFAARICKDKGIEDLINALKIVKEKHSNLRVKIIGSVDKEYKEFILKHINENGLEENTNFIGFVEKIENVHKEVSKALINVIPTYYDIIPGTIIESIFIGVPVIAYDVGSIYELNINRKSVILVEKGNVEQLAKEILQLLGDTATQDLLTKNALQTLEERFVDKEIIKNLLKIYKEILKQN